MPAENAYEKVVLLWMPSRRHRHSWPPVADIGSELQLAVLISQGNLPHSETLV
jgi:hypothetical protein